MLQYDMNALHEISHSSVMQHKIVSYLQYFSAVYNKPPEGILLIGRNTITEDLESVYSNSQKPMCAVELKDEGEIFHNRRNSQQ